MSTDTDSVTQQHCSECGRNITFMYGEGESADADAICVVCMIEGACRGDCETTADQVMLMDHRLLSRVWLVLEMVEGIVDSLDVTSDIYECGRQPLSGLDVDLSEHHLTSGTLDTLLISGQELTATLRRLVMSLVPTRETHPTETWYAVNHHPAGELVIEEWARTA